MSARENTSRWAVISLLLVIASNCAFADKTIYVDDDAAGANDGSSWADAYKYLQDALAEADSADKPVEIRVAQGIYQPDRNASEPNGTGDRTATFQLINAVNLKGGYAGFGEPDPNARDIGAYETILSGDLAGNDVDVKDPCDLQNEPTRVENSFHVLRARQADETAALEGVSVTGGNAVFVDGNLWGDLFVSAGGGIYIDQGSSLTISRCTFVANWARRGGAIRCDSSSPRMMDCNMTANAASSDGGAVSVVQGSPVIIRCLFVGNTAGYQGGAIYYCGNENPTISHCTISNNSAGMGGGVSLACWYAAKIPRISHCKISGNEAKYSWLGGGIQLQGAWDTLETTEWQGVVSNCVVTGNSTGIAVDLGAWTIQNCTIAANRNAGVQYNASNNSVIANSILWGNEPQLFIGCDVVGLPICAYVVVSHSNIEGGLAGVECRLDRWLCWMDGNTDVDPCFAGAGYGDYHLESQAGRWDPNSQSWVQDDVTSPCIDAGDPSSPIGHEPFPNGGIINMGTYGGTAEASKSYFGEPICETVVAGDIDGDCKVDFVDFKLLAAHWLEKR